MRLHGNIFVLGRVGEQGGLAVDAGPLVDRLVEQLQGGAQVGVRVDSAVVVGRVAHAERVDVSPSQPAASITLEIEDDVMLAVAPALLEGAADASARAES